MPVYFFHSFFLQWIPVYFLNNHLWLSNAYIRFFKNIRFFTDIRLFEQKNVSVIEHFPI